tara:strand:+ start:4635 stop:5762 length:1128 start_codon:yes stop_codon:yes gene_type:complete
MVDLKGQYKRIEKEVNSSIMDVINNTSFINGPSVHSFKDDLRKYLNVKHVITCANGTDALQICLMALNLKSGDEVITTDFTFASTVEVIKLLGLTPVLVDIDPSSFNIDVNKIKGLITKKTKVIMPVHLFGRVANMNEILDIADEYNLKIIEDNAQAMGASYMMKNGNIVKAGTMGQMSATSFFPSKNLGAYGDGGAIFTNDDNLANIISGIANHGMYERYMHDLVGINSRLDSIQAAILGVKLKHLDKYNDSRRESAKLYSKLLSDNSKVILPLFPLNEFSHVFHQFTLRIKKNMRDDLVKYLNKNNIPCGIYYPIPLHSQKAYSSPRNNNENFKITNQFSKEVISLPMHSELSKDQIEYITNHINKFFHEFNK